MKKVLSSIVVAAGVAAGVAAVSYIKNKKDEENAFAKEDNIAFLSSKKNTKNAVKEDVKISYANLEDTDDGFNEVESKVEIVEENNIEEAVIDDEILEEEIISNPAFNNSFADNSESDLINQVLEDNLEINEIEVNEVEDNFKLDSEAEEMYEDIVQAVEKSSYDINSEDDSVVNTIEEGPIEENVDEQNIIKDTNQDIEECEDQSTETKVENETTDEKLNGVDEVELKEQVVVEELISNEQSSLENTYLENTPDLGHYIPRFAKNINNAQPLVYENNDDITENGYDSYNDTEKQENDNTVNEEPISIADAMMNENTEIKNDQELEEVVEEELEKVDNMDCVEEDITYDNNDVSEDEINDLEIDEIESLDDIDLSLDEDDNYNNLDKAIDEENDKIESFNNDLDELNDFSSDDEIKATADEQISENDLEDISLDEIEKQVIALEDDISVTSEDETNIEENQAVVGSEINEDEIDIEKIESIEQATDTEVAKDNDNEETENVSIEESENNNEEAKEETGVNLDHLSFNLTIDNLYSNLDSDDLVQLEQMYKEVMSELNALGDVNSNERAVSHVFQFKAIEDLEKFRSRIINLGFVATKGKSPVELVVLHISTVEAKTMERAMKTLLNIAKDNNGSYKEWKSKVSM